ncbi:isoleucine--tRNA ligase, chloroplastic/mitochondrial, partial [Tanacetum coccineum]
MPRRRLGYFQVVNNDHTESSLVDDDGKFTEEAGIFYGLDVLSDGNAAMIDHLDEQHKYQYDWRLEKHTIVRATAQWCVSVEGFREAAMNAINQV